MFSARVSMAVILLFTTLAHTMELYDLKDLEDLDDNNCRTEVRLSQCAESCGLGECYDVSSQFAANWPNDGFCEVYNITHPAMSGVVRYTMEGKACLYAPDHPQGTGLLFNQISYGNYDVVYKEDQESTMCSYGYAINLEVFKVGEFQCLATTEENWHMFTVVVDVSKSINVTMTLQDGTIMSSGSLDLTASPHPITTRGGMVIVNNGTSEYLEFTDVFLSDIIVDGCFSNPCVNGGTCIDGQDGYECICIPEFTGRQCETSVVIDCYSCSWTESDDDVYRACIDDPANAPGQNTVRCNLAEGRECYFLATYNLATQIITDMYRGCDDVSFVNGCRDDTTTNCAYRCTTQLCNGANCTVPPLIALH